MRKRHSHSAKPCSVRASTAAARALAAADNEAAERVRQARAGFLPRVDVTESIQRGDQPVFVFSSLLSQRRFAAANFAIDALNHPPPVTNTRTAVAVEQSVFDAGLTKLGVESAEIRRDMAAATSAGARQDLALTSARAFVRVLQLESAARASQGAVEAADSDLSRARARRDVGLVTDADVLDVEVHLADMRQRQLGHNGGSGGCSHPTERSHWRSTWRCPDCRATRRAAGIRGNRRPPPRGPVVALGPARSRAPHHACRKRS